VGMGSLPDADKRLRTFLLSLLSSSSLYVGTSFLLYYSLSSMSTPIGEFSFLSASDCIFRLQ